MSKCFTEQEMIADYPLCMGNPDMRISRRQKMYYFVKLSFTETIFSNKYRIKRLIST
jgi:hypothetical protein